MARASHSACVKWPGKTGRSFITSRRRQRECPVASEASAEAALDKEEGKHTQLASRSGGHGADFSYWDEEGVAEEQAGDGAAAMPRMATEGV